MHPIRRDEEHRYWIPAGTGEKRVAGFTEICVDLGVIKTNPFHTEAGRQEGVALHQWNLFLAQGQEPASPPDDRIAGRVLGFRKFLADTGFKFFGGEQPVYDRINQVACTPDLWGGIGNWLWVIDNKRGGKEKTHKLQTACQKLALTANGVKIEKRGSLYLKDGDYRLIEHDDFADEVRWKAIAGGYHAKGFYK